MTQTWIAVASPLGDLIQLGDDQAVTEIQFADQSGDGTSPVDHRQASTEASTRTTDQLAVQLADYFAGRRRVFDVPTVATGTEFQSAVWAALRRIPYGDTVSYGALAALAGRPRAQRAVGSANRRNPLPIVIPCHRVVGASGRTRGYAGGIERQRILLQLEADNRPRE